MLISYKTPSVYQLPAGDVGMLVGAEYRSETMDDSRDPNINGTIAYSTVPEAANQSTFLIFLILVIAAHLRIRMEKEV